MMDGALMSWLLAGIPLLGALASLPLWSHPERLKFSSVVWSVISLGSIAGLATQLPTPPEGLLPLYLLPLAAVISLLGQPAHEDHRLSWIMTLIFLGLGVAVLTSQPRAGNLILMLLLGMNAILLHRY